MALAPRFTRRLRRTLSLLLAATLALSPVLSTAAQTHEAAHAARGEEHFHGHDALVDQPAHSSHDASHGQGDDMPDAGAMLHVLAHAAHSCGHAVAILGSDVTPPRADGAHVLLFARSTTPGDAPRAHPFRPPIA